MSMTREMAAAVKERGSATMGDLIEQFPRYSHDQIKYALKNAKRAGLLCVLSRQPHQGRTPGYAVWGIPGAALPDKPARLIRRPYEVIAVPSVFDLAGGGMRFSVPAGRQMEPLGGWAE